jgi:hypothetical protein
MTFGSPKRVCIPVVTCDLDYCKTANMKGEFISAPSMKVYRKVEL